MAKTKKPKSEHDPLKRYQFIEETVSCPLLVGDAKNLKEAVAKYEKGELHLKADEVQSGHLIEVWEDDEPVDPKLVNRHLKNKMAENESSPVDYQVFAHEVWSLLYRNLETGRHDGEETLANRSGADFLDALELLIEQHRLPFQLDEPT